ncbi:MAG: hypothetical protein CMM56_02400 [Rhodospirillaceae bacterium]|nr:hypothetical protein [Rhodospirillaceae bacterium]|tara:strand:- start:892 stop:1836 length:945 start_codon:yes stop_codon:yes gene_type:complete
MDRFKLKISIPLISQVITILLLSLQPVSSQINSLGSFENSICQSNEHAIFHACAIKAAALRPQLTTADNRPDFSGYWRRRAWIFEDFEAHPVTADDFGGTSGIVDPPDGKIPIQPWAKEKSIENAERYLHHNAACFLSGPAGTMYMTSRFQFQQDDQYLIMVGEQLTAHPYRIIPLDGRPHAAEILMWNGDPRGHWDGNTLIINSPNHNAKYLLDQRGHFITEEATITERMTLVDHNTIHYSATFEDPNVYKRPFTVAFAFRRDADENPEIWEEACYENNKEQMRLFLNNGYMLYPGITGAEARQLKIAWEQRQ